jgi:hypothetical protein
MTNQPIQVGNHPLERLYAHLVSSNFDISGRIDPPFDPRAGTWLLDLLYRNTHFVTVGWQADHGFGLWLPSDEPDYGTGFDEVFETYDAVLVRIMELLRK